MKYKEEPSAHSPRGNPSLKVNLYFPDDDGTETTGSLSRPGPTAAARAEQPALTDPNESLMELIVDEANVEAAWKNVKRNRGAPGPDGETIDEFFEAFRHRWPEIRQQPLDGTYEPSPVRRKAIDKPDGEADSGLRCTFPEIWYEISSSSAVPPGTTSEHSMAAHSSFVARRVNRFFAITKRSCIARFDLSFLFVFGGIVDGDEQHVWLVDRAVGKGWLGRRKKYGEECNRREAE